LQQFATSFWKFATPYFPHNQRFTFRGANWHIHIDCQNIIWIVLTNEIVLKIELKYLYKKLYFRVLLYNAVYLYYLNKLYNIMFLYENNDYRNQLYCCIETFCQTHQRFVLNLKVEGGIRYLPSAELVLYIAI